MKNYINQSIKKHLFKLLIATLILVVASVMSCDEETELIEPSIETKWAVPSKQVVNEMKNWYQENLNLNARKDGSKAMWSLSEYRKLSRDNYILSTPLVELGKDDQLKTLYLFRTEDGVNSFIIEQKPDPGYLEEYGISFGSNFSGLVSIYGGDGKLKSTSKLSNGNLTDQYSINGNIAGQGMSTLRTSSGETEAIILQEVVIHGSRIESGTNWIWLESGSTYWDVVGVFPGTVYDGFYGGAHNYLSPMATATSVGYYLEFAGGPPVNILEIINCFSNSSSAMNRSVTIYVDQPKKNSRETWAGVFSVDPGHTFIKLSQTNFDGSVIERIVGYYPETGVNPIVGNHTDNSIFRDDNSHDYDVSIEWSNVTSSAFNQLLGVLVNYGGSTYNLNSSNCTDVAFDVANELGVSLPDTQGAWPGGAGSNPADLAEDLRGWSSNSSYTIDKTGGTAFSANAMGGGCLF